MNIPTAAGSAVVVVGQQEMKKKSFKKRQMYMSQSCEPLRAVSVNDEPFCLSRQEITKA